MDDTEIDDERSFTIGRFCDIEDMSLSTYHKMKRLDLGPAETRMPNTKILERKKWTSKSEGRMAMKQLREALRPFMDRGLRVRVALSHTRLDEDEIWKP